MPGVRKRLICKSKGKKAAVKSFRELLTVIGVSSFPGDLIIIENNFAPFFGIAFAPPTFVCNDHSF